MELVVKDKKGKDKGNISFLTEYDSLEVNRPLIHEVVLNYLANNRQGTSSTKTRAEVSGGGKKPWKQKGTGRARCGSNRSPIWRHGGITFGPKPRDYSYSIPAKKKRAALISALLDTYKSGRLFAIEEIDANIEKTKLVNDWVKSLSLEGNVLVVLKDRAAKFERATRNLVDTDITYADKLCTYDVMWYDNVVLTKDAVSFLEEKFIGGKK